VKREAILVLERMVQVGGADVLARRYFFNFSILERKVQVVGGGDGLQHKCSWNFCQKRPNIESKDT
jgi:hypothetical protein